MHSIGIFMAELFDDFADFLIFLVGTCFSDNAFKSADHKQGRSISHSMSYSRAPCFLLSYSLSVSSRWTD